MDNLLTKCNADVYKAILDIKAKQPVIGEKLIALLQEHQYSWKMIAGDMLWFSAHLPLEIWDGKVHTFQFLFLSQQQTTPMQ
jgi:hypothetical protein